MTVYNLKLTVPFRAIDISYTTETIEIEGDVLHRVNILIPSGHMGLTGLRIRYGMKQIVPWNEGEWLSGDGQYLELTPNWVLPESPCLLTVEAYNEDYCYDHTFYITLETRSYEEVFGPRKYDEVISKLAELLGVA